MIQSGNIRPGIWPGFNFYDYRIDFFILIVLVKGKNFKDVLVFNGEFIIWYDLIPVTFFLI